MEKLKFLLIVIGLTGVCMCGDLMAQEVRLGIIADLPNEAQLNQLNQPLLEEIRKTLGPSRPVSLVDSNVFTINWKIEPVAERYETLQERVDLILLIGAVSIRGALDRGVFEKPTIGLGVFDTDIQQIPYEEPGISGMPNFSYVLTARDLETEISKFREIVPFDSLTVIFDSRSDAAFNEVASIQKFAKIQEKLGIRMQGFELGEDIEVSLDQMPRITEAVFLVIPYERSAYEIKQIADILIDQKIPTFSLNRQDLDQGIMSSYSTANGFPQIMRKIAVMADGVMNGELLETMPVSLNVREEIFLNMVVARKIGFNPSFNLLFTANLIGDEADLDLPTYSIQQVIEKGLAENLQIKINAQEIDLVEQDIKTAKSQFLPTVTASATGVQVDSKSTSPITGNAETTLSGAGTVEQLVFSEQAIANIKIQQYLQDAQKHATQQVVIDLILDVFNAYFSILQLKANLNIQEENLSSSQKNLELAKLRSRLGYSSNADVYRWESEVANAKQALIEANANLILAKVQMNRLLNNTLEEDYDIVDITIEDDFFRIGNLDLIGNYVTGPAELKILTLFMIDEAKINFPTKQQLMANLDALNRQELMNKRLFYTPNVAVQGQVNNIWYRGGNGSVPAEGITFNNLPWNLGLSLSYPLFDGTRRQINLQTTHIQQEQLNNQITDLDQSLSLAVRSKILDMLTSRTNIAFSKTASENASKNFDLVQGAYTQGSATIIQLLDAQNASLQSKLAYALSIYEYLQAYIGLENAVGSYSLLATEEENLDFERRFSEFINNKK